MKMIFDDFKTLVETFHGTSLHLNSYLVSSTPEFTENIAKKLTIQNDEFYNP
jgi:hypothetical protein